jgi:hypothetical protein
VASRTVTEAISTTHADVRIPGARLDRYTAAVRISHHIARAQATTSGASRTGEKRG